MTLPRAEALRWNKFMSGAVESARGKTKLVSALTSWIMTSTIELFFRQTLGCMILAMAWSIHGQEIQNLDAIADSRISSDSLAQASAPDSAAAALRGETEQARLYWLRRRAFVESVFEQSAYHLADSALFFRFVINSEPLGLDQKELSQLSSRPDYIGDRLKSQQGGASSQFNLGDLIGKGVKYLAGKLGATKSAVSPWTILPSETEIRVMNALWRKNEEATSAEIYAQLDSARLNYKEVNTVLENMVGRGLVERRQISPSNEFTVLGALTIEMSSLNAKNREYVYRPLASRELMLAYLDASAFLRQWPHTPAEAMRRAHLRKLLAMIAKETGEL